MKLGDRLVQLRKEKEYTREEFSELLGISKYTLRNYELGVTEPGHPFLIKIANLFDTSIDYILGLTDERERMSNYTLKSSEYDRIKKYRYLDDHGKESVDIILDRETERVKLILDLQKQLSTQTDRITELESNSQFAVTAESYPLTGPPYLYTYLGKIACAGTGFYFDDIPTDIIEAPFMHGADFIIGVNGDSMEPDYHDGERLYIQKVRELTLGDTGIFTFRNECFVKELGERGLISKNSNYDDIPGTEDVRFIGRVLGKVEEQS